MARGVIAGRGLSWLSHARPRQVTITDMLVIRIAKTRVTLHGYSDDTTSPGKKTELDGSKEAERGVTPLRFFPGLKKHSLKSSHSLLSGIFMDFHTHESHSSRPLILCLHLKYYSVS